MAKNNWKAKVGASWKHLYNEEPAWRRWGLNGSIQRKLNHWSISGGLNTYYTFHEDLDNFLEIRPWFGIGLKTKIRDRLEFNQQFKSELRSFIYSEVNRDNESYGRLRYRIGLDYVLHEEEESESEWKLVAELEWYLLREPATGERFSNSREYIIKVVRRFKNRHELAIGYTLEHFNRLFREEETRGNTFSLSYSL